MKKRVKEIVVKIGCYTDCRFANEDFDKCELNPGINNLYVLCNPKLCPLRKFNYIIKLGGKDEK